MLSKAEGVPDRQFKMVETVPPVQQKHHQYKQKLDDPLHELIKDMIVTLL